MMMNEKKKKKKERERERKEKEKKNNESGFLGNLWVFCGLLRQ
jgi:hypothetical protein